jgi:Predicted membrane protein involved in D-alanine export
MAAAGDKAQRRLWLVVSLVANLGILGYFKYGQFLLENFQALLALAGITYVPPALDIVLPVGISFYTFQTMSYSLDIYRGQLQPVRSFRDFALYVTFFPQLVAGPIVRAIDFLPQLVTEPSPAPAASPGACFS